MSFDLFPNEQSAALLNAARHPSTAPDPGVFDNFASGAGQYTMRSLAEAGRALDMAGAVFPIMVDKVTGGTVRQDQYFKEHDEVFNNAVDYWTPRPGEVGTAGQVAGQLFGGVLQAVISPALLIGSTQLSSAEDLVRNGVDSSTANVVGAIQGTGAAVGLKLPFLGQSLATRLLSGAGGNLAQGTFGALASSTVLKDAGYEQQAEQFNPWDFRARVLDVMLGAAFGGMAHIGRKSNKPTPQEDYQAFLSEYGLSESIVKSMSESGGYHASVPPGTSILELRPSKISGNGMFATKSAQVGDVLSPATIDGIGTQAARYTNHSNEANAEYRRNSKGDVDLVAIKPIKADSEVVSDYRTSADVFGFNSLKRLTKVTPTDEAALLVANQARHLEDSTPNGRPATDADATLHVDAMRQAINQVLRGDPVIVDAITRDMRLVPDESQHQQRVEVVAEAQRIATEVAPVDRPILPGVEPGKPMPEIDPAAHEPASLKARQMAVDQPDLTIATNQFDASGQPIHMKAADALAHADAEVANAQARAANIFKTAAHCLLGAL